MCYIYILEKEILFRILQNLVPSAPPQNFTAIGGQYLYSKWIPPPSIDQNGVLVEYFIEYFGVERDITIRNISVPSSQLYYILTGLNEFTTYRLRIRASTSVGPGPFTQFITVTTIAARK